MKKLLVITPIKHIANLAIYLEKNFIVDYLDDPSQADLKKIIHAYDAIYTNPNKSKVFLGEDILQVAKKLKVICTASTGTNHIDKNYSAQNSIKIISLTEERDVINQISSTAELAFALTLAGCRNLMQAGKSVSDGEWDYTKFIGRQLNALTIGVVGYGRLGKMYSNYCKAFGATVLAYDPYKKIETVGVKQVFSLSEICAMSDIISIHVHANKETKNMFGNEQFSKMKPNILLVNTARGEVIDENALAKFLDLNINAKAYLDVLSDEITNRKACPLFKFQDRGQVFITPHIGGMTVDAQFIAYHHAAKLLVEYWEKNNANHR